MPFPLLVPLIAAAVSGVAKAAGSASSKDSSDYMNDIVRHDVKANQANTNSGQVGSYGFFNPDTGTYTPYLDRGNAADQFSALNDPNSQRSLDYELGGKRGFAEDLSRGLGDKADAMFSNQAEQASLGADRYYGSLQQGLLSAYADQARGVGPAIADVQGNSALSGNTRNMLAAGSVGTIADQRQAMLGGARAGMMAGSNFAAQRSKEAADAMNAANGLGSAMSNSAISNAQRQSKIDLANRVSSDALAINYLGQQRSIRDAQFNAGNMRAADMLSADDMRKRENLAEAQGAADRHNRDVNTVTGAFSSGASAMGSLVPGKKS